MNQTGVKSRFCRSEKARSKYAFKSNTKRGRVNKRNAFKGRKKDRSRRKLAAVNGKSSDESVIYVGTCCETARCSVIDLTNSSTNLASRKNPKSKSSTKLNNIKNETNANSSASIAESYGFSQPSPSRRNSLEVLHNFKDNEIYSYLTDVTPSLTDPSNFL